MDTVIYKTDMSIDFLVLQFKEDKQQFKSQDLGSPDTLEYLARAWEVAPWGNVIPIQDRKGMQTGLDLSLEPSYLRQF